MKKCPFCAEDIQDAAIVCRFCQRPVAPEGEAVSQAALVNRSWSPGVAAVLSLVIPGAGQLYKGQVGKGIGFFVATVVGYLLFIFPGLALHLFAIVVTAQITRTCLIIPELG